MIYCFFPYRYCYIYLRVLYVPASKKPGISPGLRLDLNSVHDTEAIHA